MSIVGVCKLHEVEFYRGVCDICALRALLYDCIMELEYVQCVESPGDHSLCATAMGKQLVERGMKLLGAKDLSAGNGVQFIVGERQDRAEGERDKDLK